MGRANFRVAGIIALLMIVATVLVAWLYDLPVRDPDGVAVPTYVRLPVIVLIAFLIDVLPRALATSWRDLGRFPSTFGRVIKERWSRAHVLYMLSGLGAWYVIYATFRNLKGYVPFVNPHLWDSTLNKIDRTLWLGHDPANVLHSLFGTNLAAHFFSFIYIAWIVLIPVLLAVALVWTRSPVKGAWFVTAAAFDWILGVMVYYLVPTLGPIYSDPGNFADLAHTNVSAIEKSLMDDRLAVFADPWATHTVQTIAAFASLHVAMMMTVCVFAELADIRRGWRVLSWVFFALTVLSTIYLGWHFFMDTVAGAVLGAAAVWFAALATGNMKGWRPRLAQAEGEHHSDFNDAPRMPA